MKKRWKPSVKTEQGTEKIQLEKHDIPALLLAAALVFIPALAAVAGFFVLLAYWVL
ncbi:hypothetical protein [Bianquea renquensis]|jgi:hypothetical protein|uniref:Uncharacterized protein n=1 Tax=Bianquea renquensis TaxID=2763661 RepID=A0A926DQM9_9FIRM|nr:hypothetical protein [Bianquea renquensis]MBC8542216.1 hypothetical protein [Bianquea renquensis]